MAEAHYSNFRLDKEDQATLEALTEKQQGAVDQLISSIFAPWDSFRYVLKGTAKAEDVEKVQESLTQVAGHIMDAAHRREVQRESEREGKSQAPASLKQERFDWAIRLGGTSHALSFLATELDCKDPNEIDHITLGGLAKLLEGLARDTQDIVLELDG